LTLSVIKLVCHALSAAYAYGSVLATLERIFAEHLGKIEKSDGGKKRLKDVGKNRMNDWAYLMYRAELLSTGTNRKRGEERNSAKLELNPT
jgi:hypothetical protein